MQNETMNTMLMEIRQQPEVLQKTIQLNEPNLKEIWSSLAPKIAREEIDQVMIVARGSSDNAATVGKYLFESLLGIPVSLAAPSVVNHYRAKMKLHRALVIGVSQSGCTNEVIDFMEQVRSESGYTIGITNQPQSELVKLGLDGYLFCHAGTEEAVAATKSFTTTMMAFYLLVTALSPDLEHRKMLRGVPEYVARVFKEEDALQEIGKSLAKEDECIILARGYNYPIGLEVGLKLQETSYIRAKAFSGADFQHGPLAITESGVPFLIFKAAGPTYEGMNWLEASVREKGGAVTVFSSLPDEEMATPKNRVLIPEYPEWLSPFGFVLAGQILAYYTARDRGVNPNHPRWLNKVTATR